MKIMSIRKVTLPLMALALLLGLCACGAPQTAQPPDAEVTGPLPRSTPQAETPQESVSEEPARKGANILVAYFSCTGTTEALADAAAELLSADLFEIVPEEPYTEADLNYSDDNSRASREQADTTARPAISGMVEDMAQYDTVLIGYPIWHGQAPRIMSTFLEGYDFAGKTIVPFCTSHSSGLGTSDTNLHGLAPNASWREGARFPAGTSGEEVSLWLNDLQLLMEQEENDMHITVTVNGVDFPATLNDSVAARELYAMLPLTLNMAELNGNEKHGALPSSPTAQDQSVDGISEGDLMLYGGDTLVLFYESFATQYRYTPLGRLTDPSGLKEAMGTGDVRVTFSAVASKEAGVFDLTSKTVLLSSGYEMPIMGLGTYALSDEECYNSVTTLLENGGRLIDTAYMYHNEAAVGRAVRESDIPREEIFVTTKLYPNQFSDAAGAIDEALEKMGLDYIDLMLLHHPGTGDVEAYKALEQAVADGKLRSIGLSNWYVEELEEFLPQVNITPAVVQNEIHPYYQENDVIPYIHELGIVVEGWFPLGGRGHTKEMLSDETISAIAAAHNVTSAQVILRWNLQKGVVVIPGSSNPEHIKENLDLFGFELTESEMEQINALDRNEKHEWY